MRSERFSQKLAHFVERLGFPTFVALLTMGFLFFYYLPKHDEMTEDRIHSMLDTHNKFREDQAKIIKDQSDTFKTTMKDTMSVVGKLEQSIRELSVEIKKMEQISLQKRGG